MAFENAMRVSRLAREHLDADDASIVSVALDAAGQEVTGASLGVALVIGTGGFARTCVDEVRRRGTHTVLVHSPTGRSVPSGLADHVVSPDELPMALTLADVVVGASGHGVPVVTDAHVEQAMNGRAVPLVLVDLAGTGDVSPTVDAHPDVLLVRIDDVRRRAIGSDAASSVICREAAMLHPRIEGREVDDVIVALRQHIEAIAGVDESVDPAVAEAVRRITRTILHTPTVRAREAAQSGDLERYRSALETVFGIEHRADADAVSRGSAA
jgi:glutamyl-tRNA reductase